MAPRGARLNPFTRELTALLVEDDATSRLLATAQLRGVFKELIQAGDGREGLALFRARRPDLVLTDDQMPELSGIAMVEAIRQEDPRVPVILVTASMDTDLLVRAINLGISAFIPKPVALDSLLRAIDLVAGLLENDHLQRRTVEQELALLQFREKYHETQQEIAFRKELSFQENDYACRSFQAGPAEWLAQVHYRPHDIMCGDSYSLRRLPDGGLLIYLGDAMGKGLAASLTTSLAVYTFNLQVDALPEGPFDFQAFTASYLARMGKRLLEDEVFSLGLAWLPANGEALETALFGMPPVLVRAPGGAVARLRSRNPPLSAYLEGFQVTRTGLADAEALLFYTDGLNEAVLAGGDLYAEHLETDFAGAASRTELERVFQTRVARPDDDVTFLMLTRLDGPAPWEETWVIQARLAEVEAAGEVVEARLAANTGLDPDTCTEFGMAAREALLNAYEHGSLEIPSAMKNRLVSEGTYFDHLLAAEAALDRRITLVLARQALGTGRLVRITIRDQGPGFTPPAPGPGTPDRGRVSGRGLRLVARYTDAYLFNDQGNALTLVKITPGDPDAAGTDRHP